MIINSIEWLKNNSDPNYPPGLQEAIIKRMEDNPSELTEEQIGILYSWFCAGWEDCLDLYDIRPDC